MKSQTSLAARNCRLQEWSQMVHSCNNRPIGMSVNEWCRENSITTANYYYRMTQVRKACLDSLSDEAVNHTDNNQREIDLQVFGRNILHLAHGENHAV